MSLIDHTQEVIAENVSIEKLTEYTSELALNSKKFEENVLDNMKSSMQLVVQKIPIFMVTNP